MVPADGVDPALLHDAGVLGAQGIMGLMGMQPFQQQPGSSSSSNFQAPGSNCSGPGVQYADSEYESDDDYSDSDDDEFEYGDESDADEDSPGVGRFAAGPLLDGTQSSVHVFRNEKDVVFGFWSKCPLG
jgi:hypothetical protein